LAVPQGRYLVEGAGASDVTATGILPFPAYAPFGDFHREWGRLSDVA